jgi:hypothetical protein
MSVVAGDITVEIITASVSTVVEAGSIFTAGAEQAVRSKVVTIM